MCIILRCNAYRNLKFDGLTAHNKKGSQGCLFWNNIKITSLLFLQQVLHLNA